MTSMKKTYITALCEDPRLLAYTESVQFDSGHRGI